MSLSSHPERDALPARLRERLEGTLREGEQLLWLGRPDAGRRARWEALRAASRGFSTLFVGAGLLAVSKPWELANPGVPVPPWLWAVAWGALGLVALSVCWGAFRALRRARRTAYAVTDQRALVCRDLLFSSGHSLERADVGLVRVRTWPGGRGEVHFEPRVAYERPARREEGATSFVYLNDVDDARRAVEQLLGRELPEEKFGRAAGDVPPRPDTSDVHELSDALRDRLHGELAEGERILWLGRPPPGTMMARAAIPAGCVFLLVTGCAGMLAAFVGVVGWFFPPAAWPRFVSWIVVPVVGLAGLAVLLSPLSARHRARRTAYVITDRRALLVRVGWGSRVYSYGRTALHELQVRELEDGRGEVIFEEKVRIRIRTDDSGSEQRHTHVVGFLEVAPVEPARRALEEMLGRPVTAQRIQSMSLNQHHPI